MLSYDIALVAAALATLALAKTDLTGCTSTDVSSPSGASVAWYVPGTGERCDFLDCGGGMAPPKTNVPGCPLYSGTSTYSPSYLPGFGSMTAAASSSWTQAAATASSVTSDTLETHSASSSWGLRTTAPPAASPSSAWTTPINTMSPSNSSMSSSFESAVASAYFTSSSPAPQNGTAPSGYTSGGVQNSTMILSVTPSLQASSRATVTSVAIASGSGSNVGGVGGNAPASTTGPTSSSTPSTVNGADTAKPWVGASFILGLGVVLAAL